MLGVILGVAAPLALSGCGTLEHGTEQVVEIRSVPSGARLAINGEPHGETPASVSLSRRRYHDVRVEMEGYYPAKRRIQKVSTDAFYGNAAIPYAAPLAMAFDIMTGGVYRLEPASVELVLEPLPPPWPTPENPDVGAPP